MVTDAGGKAISYEQIFSGIVALGYMDRSLVDFGCAVRVAIKREQRKASPDNQLLNTLYDAARLGWELSRGKEGKE